MYYKVPGTTSQVNENTVAVDPGRVDSDPERGVVEAGPRDRVELPAVPGTAQDQLPTEVVATRPPRDALLDGPEAERTTMVGTAVAHAAQLATYCHDADLTPFHAGDDVTVSLEVGERADVVPAAHAAMSPRRSP
jgi:hypothetical protein